MNALELRSHLLVWVALVVLLLLSVASSFLPLGMFNVICNFLIGAGKASLVLFFFMRIGRSTVTVFFAAAAGLVWLAWLIGLGLADFLWRGV